MLVTGRRSNGHPPELAAPLTLASVQYLVPSPEFGADVTRAVLYSGRVALYIGLGLGFGYGEAARAWVLHCGRTDVTFFAVRNSRSCIGVVFGVRVDPRRR
jgi:hypothetical protein